MKRKFFRTGNGWAIFMPKVLLELMDIDPEVDEINIKVVNNTMVVRKLANEGKKASE